MHSPGRKSGGVAQLSIWSALQHIDFAAKLSLHEGLAAFVSEPFEEATRMGSLESHSGGNGSSWARASCDWHADDGCCLPSGSGVAKLEARQLNGAHLPGSVSLDIDPLSIRKRGGIKDRASRHLVGTFGKVASTLRGMRARCRRGDCARSLISDFPECNFSVDDAREHRSLARFEDTVETRCGGRHGKCSFRSGRHFHLDSGSRTRKAEKYTKALCEALANDLVLCQTLAAQRYFRS